MPAHELAPEHALLPDRRVSRAHVQPRAADDDLALLDDRPGIRRHALAIDARAVFRAEVLDAHPAVLQQRQQCVLRRRMLVVHDDVAAEVAADPALGAGDRKALLQDRVSLRADLFDEHHGFHCRAPR